jgi:hypothetical protein
LETTGEWAHDDTLSLCSVFEWASSPDSTLIIVMSAIRSDELAVEESSVFCFELKKRYICLIYGVQCHFQQYLSFFQVLFIHDVSIMHNQTN